MRFVSPPTPRASGRSTTVVQRGNPSLATTTVRPPGVFLTTREPAQTRARYGRPVQLRGDDHPLQVGLSFFHPRGADLTCAPRAYRDGVPLNATSNSDIDLASSPVPAAGRFTSLPSSARPEPTHKFADRQTRIRKKHPTLLLRGGDARKTPRPAALEIVRR